MNRTSLLGIALSLSTLNHVTLPALAQTPTSVNQQATNRLSMIPKSTAISIVFQDDTIFTKDTKQDSITTLLAQPILDNNNNAVALANSLVNTRLKRVKGGAEISVESVVIGGREIPVQTSSRFIPDKTIAEIRAEQKGKTHARIGKAIGILTAGTAGTKTETMEKMASGGALLGLAFGSKKEKKKAVIIPKGTVYLFSLKSPVALNISVVSPTAVKSSPNSYSFIEAILKSKSRAKSRGR